jgi:hypothetical protein
MQKNNKCGRCAMKQIIDYQAKEEQLYLFPAETKKASKEVTITTRTACTIQAVLLAYWQSL